MYDEEQLTESFPHPKKGGRHDNRSGCGAGNFLRESMILDFLVSSNLFIYTNTPEVLSRKSHFVEANRRRCLLSN